MTRELERQRWLAALALVVALPLPLTGIASWPFVAAFASVALLVLTSRRQVPPLRPWMENVLAPLILIAVVAAGGMRYGVLRPMAQLAILVAAVRLPGSGQRSRGALTAAMLGIVGVAGIASSTHPTLALYLLGLLAFVLLLIGRFVAISLEDEGARGPRGAAWPPTRLVAGTMAVAMMAAVPVFLVLPRLRSPFAGMPFGVRATSGFREAVALHGIGDIKLSRRVVMRVSFPGTEANRISPDWLREAGATMRRYRAGSWVEGRLHAESLPVRAGQPLALAPAVPGAKLRRVGIRLEADTGTLFMPLGAVSLRVPDGVAVSRERGGTLRTRFAEPPLAYTVDFDPRRVIQPPPDASDLDLPPDSGRLRQLAAGVARGATNPIAASLAIEQYLQANYRYALSTNPPLREDPVQWFLFRSREGHCEFFASSMVLLLRTLGIPARLQAGFAGGERAGEGEFVVRDSNAHAWVLAWMSEGDSKSRAQRPRPWTARTEAEPSGGKQAEVNGVWRVFDPTPPEGRPGIGEGGAGRGLRWGWQQFETAWDRWVLTFSLGDQLEGLRQGLDAIAANTRVVYEAAGGLAALAACAVLWRTRHRRSRRASPAATQGPGIVRALERVLGAASRSGVPVTRATTPRQLSKALQTRFPSLAGPLTWLVEAHERCRYAGGGQPPGTQVRRAVRLIERGIRAGARPS